MPPKKSKDPASPPVSNPGPAQGWNNPTALDLIFIVLMACTLMLFLLWVLYGGDTKYSNAPQFIVDMGKSVWAKISFAGGSAGALLLRRFLDNKSPSPNYLIWIPSFLGILIAALFVLSKVLPPPPPPLAKQDPVPPQLVRMHASFGLDKNPSTFEIFHKKPQQPDFKLWESLPDQIDAHGVYYNSSNPSFPYRDTLNVKQGGRSLAYIELASTESDTRGSDTFDYRICLQPGSKTLSGDSSAGIVLSCSNGVCSPAKPDDPGYVVGTDCNAKSENTGDILSVVLADEGIQQSREPGWKVPSVTTLQKMTDRQRVGYTLFDVAFTPAGKAKQADRYYFALRVNDLPIYVDGLSPGLEKLPLQQDAANHIVFGLENLNFTGQFEGYEKLHLSVYFLSGNTVVFRQDLDRTYIALRDATPIPPIQTSVGSFQWSGAYIVPKNENKYEVMLASSDCGDPPRKDCVDRAVNAKLQFDKAGLKFGEEPVVMVVRPPLRIPPAYGLTLGLVRPTGQVQFTFGDTEASQVCRWALDQAGRGAGGKLIRTDLRRYEVSTRGYAPCH